MEINELLARVYDLAWPNRHLRLDWPKPPAGSVRVPVPDGVDPYDLVDALSNRHGEPVDAPALDCGDEVAWLYAWPHSDRWFVFGRGTGDDAPHLAIATRSTPQPEELPADASWLERLVAVTGWVPPERPAIDWAAVESRLGTPLPSDYKRLVETFGDGAFDGFHGVFPPEEVISRAEYDAAHGAQEPWEPHPPFPAAGGRLLWAANEAEQEIAWLTEGPDPDRWPVHAKGCGPVPGQRFDSSSTEFLFRQLTDRQHPFCFGAGVRAHWFERGGV
ncbi:SMI1/KNR4 family protein [Streptomyces sp. NPDC127098]|uniref:SMI1/KNR4 family protein n=1 Tax=Streptomyces sp. NPDC127098 TaxID=3347137 RepID=UPI003652818E